MYPNEPLIADFSYYPLHREVNTTIQFIYTTSDEGNNIISWLWDFGEGNTSIIKNPMHSYSNIGIYPVFLLVRDNYNSTSSITKIVLVGIIPDWICNFNGGWNMKSQPGYDPINKTDLIILYNYCYYSWIQAVQNNIVSDFIFGWNSAIQSYIFADTIYPTEGYWFYSYEDCTLIVV